jgi:hypothetical protein
VTVQRVDELDVVCVVPLGAQNAVKHLCYRYCGTHKSAAYRCAARPAAYSGWNHSLRAVCRYLRGGLLSRSSSAGCGHRWPQLGLMVKANGYAADLTLAEDSADQGKQVAQATDVVRSTEPERPTELNSRRNAHASGPEDSMRLYERQCMRWRDKELLHTVVR